MSEVLEQLQAVQRESQDLERRRAKREADRDVAKARLEENLVKLKDEFGVESLTDARSLLAEMDLQVKQGIGALRERLKEIR